MEKMTRKEFIEDNLLKAKAGSRPNLSISLTTEEHSELKAKAAVVGVSISNYVRSILFYEN